MKLTCKMVKTLLWGGLVIFTAFAFFSQAHVQAEEVGTSTDDIPLDLPPMVGIQAFIAGGPDVAVLYYCTDAGGGVGATNVVNTLEADGRFGSATLIDGDIELPTAGELLASYDAVIAMTDNRCGAPMPYADSAADALTGFANGGGGVVVCTFGFSQTPPGIGFGASIFGPGLCPLQQEAPYTNAPAGAIDIPVSPSPPCDELLDGVTSPVSSQYANHVSVSGGATLCASYTNGRPLLAINAAGNVVGLNTFPASGSDNSQASYRRLISNAVYFVSERLGIEKELIDGPPEIGIYKSVTTQYIFEINYSGPDALVMDTVPAEFEVTDTSESTGAVDVFSANNKGNDKSATIITWLVPEGSSTLTVTIQTRQSPGKGHGKKGMVVYKPTSCGTLNINDGAMAYQVDEDGPILDPDTGEMIPIEGLEDGSEPLEVEAVCGEKPCAPENLTVTLVGDDTLSLDWDDVCVGGDPVVYTVYRDGELIAEGLSASEYDDENLAPGDYCYEVEAEYVGGGPGYESGKSNEACETVPEPAP